MKFSKFAIPYLRDICARVKQLASIQNQGKYQGRGNLKGGVNFLMTLKEATIFKILMLKTAIKLKILTQGVNFLNCKAILRVRASLISFSDSKYKVLLIESKKMWVKFKYAGKF